MRKLLFAAFAVGAVAALSTSPADASGGCGPYRHRTPMGFCRPGGGVYGGYYGGYYAGPGWYGGRGWYGHPGWGWRRWRRWGYY